MSLYDSNIHFNLLSAQQFLDYNVVLFIQCIHYAHIAVFCFENNLCLNLYIACKNWVIFIIRTPIQNTRESWLVLKVLIYELIWWILLRKLFMWNCILEVAHSMVNQESYFFRFPSEHTYLYLKLWSFLFRSF